MEVSTDVGHQITARKLMHIMLYDNGVIIYCEPDNEARYPKFVFDKITKACEVLFDKHPELLTDDNLELIAAGCREDVDKIFKEIPEFENLDKLLNEYFDIM